MTHPPDIYWNPGGSVAWHRGFEIRVVLGAGSSRSLQFYARSVRQVLPVNSDGLVLVEKFKGRVKAAIDRQIKGKVANLLTYSLGGYAAVDYVPWEIHRISNTLARTAATKAYLMEAEIPILVGLHWPPFTADAARLTFPTGDVTKPEIKL